MKKLLIPVVVGLSGLIGGAIGHSVGYDNGRADQAAKQVTAVRVESTRHPLSLDDSLKILIATGNGRQYVCDNSMPTDQDAPCTYNSNPGVGFVSRDAYKHESSVGGQIIDSNL